MYNNNLTAQHQQQHQQHQQHQQPQPQPDIYALLSTDDTVEIDESIDTDALVMDIFDSFTPNTAPSPAVPQIQQLRYDEHPLSSNGSSGNNSVDSNSAFPTPTSTVSSNTNEFGLNQDILGNFDITSNNQQHQQQTQQQQQQQHQYTPSSSSGICIDPIFSLSFPEQDSIFPSFDPPPPIRNNIGFARRHSVAVSGGIADFNILNLSQNYQSTSQSTFNNHTYTAQTPPQNQTQSTTLPQRLPVQQQSQQQQLLNKQAPFLSQKIGQHLTTVVEGETPSNMGHRASMPNIFLSEESQRQLTNSIQQRNGSLSARTTPNSTPPPISIDFNQMPWSNTSNNSISAATKPNHINNDFHDTNSPQFHDWTSSTNTLTSHPPVSQAPVANVEDHSFTGRKRFYSQQFPNFPTRSQHRIVPFNQTPYRTLQQPPGSSSSSNNSMCPLPMSGIVSRRASIATPHDISAWNRMVNPNDRILLEQQEQTSQKRAKDEEPATKRLRADESELSENTSASGSIVSTENNGPKEEEDYPVITDADLEAAKKDANAIPRRQKLRFDEDDYTPKWVRYTGQSKEGYCDTCKPGKWLQLKNSAYWYHKQFYHGISSVSGKIFQRPLEQRAGEHDVIEGLCHQCQQFVPICNSKRKNSVLWFRHAHKCHVYDKPKTKGAKRPSISVPTTKRHQLNEQLQKIY